MTAQSSPATLPASTAPSSPRALVLPAVLPAHPPVDLARALPGIERTFRDAIGRHGGLTLVGQTEIAAMMEQVAQAQLTGCDSDGCLAQVGEALGADLVVSTRLELTDGLWVLRAAILDRRDASAARRTLVRARSLEGLVNSLDVAARQLCMGSAVSVAHPRLHERLGTTPEAAAELAARVRQDPKADVVQTWTDIVIERNGERPWPALLVAGGVALSALTLWAFSMAVPTLLYPVQAPMDRLKPTYRGEERTDPVSADGTYKFPWLLFLAYVMVTPPAALISSLGLGLALVAAAVDNLDVGRIPVAKEGCCRDEERVREAAEPAGLHRAATLTTGVAAVLTLLAVPCLGVTSSYAVQGLMLALFPGGLPVGAGPTVPVSRQAWIAISSVGAFSSVGGLLFSLVSLAAVSVLCTLGLAASERVAVVD